MFVPFPTCRRRTGSGLAILLVCLWASSEAADVDQPVEPGASNGTAFQQPTAERPLLHTRFFTRNHGSGGRVPEQLFWRDSRLVEKVDTAREANRRSIAEGIKPLFGLMMWGGVYYDSEPGSGRQHSDKPAYNAYWRWNHERRHYFARRADGRTWSRNYAEDGTAKEAWITPSRPLDPGDRSADITTFGDWYAQRIAERAAAIDARGVLLADYADQMPHSTALDQDFSEPIVADFERWSGIDVPGDDPASWAAAIRRDHLSAWIDYLSDAYGRWWLDMARRIEDATGGEAVTAMQKHSFPHSSRYHAADLIWMRKHAERPSQIAYHVETWSPPSPRGGAIGDGEISAYVGQLGTHLCREPDIVRGAFVPTTGHVRYPGGDRARGTDHFRMIDHADRIYSLSLSADQKTEMQDAIQRGAWMALGWTHLAARSGRVERAAMYFFTHWSKDENPYDLFHEVIQPIAPTRPYGPAFYYSTSTERAFERRQEMWNPLPRIADAAKRGDDGHVMLAYFVSDQTLPTLDEDARPTAWVVDEPETLADDERRMLEAVAPIHDIHAADPLPTAALPIRFFGDATGFAFVDQRDRVIVFVTRDHVLSDQAIVAEIRFRDVPDGEYRAVDLETGQEIGFRVAGGEGVLQVPLERWSSRAFHTDLPPRD